MKPTRVRWTVVALIFLATTINYIDRQVIGLLKPYIQDDLGWSEADYGYIVTAITLQLGWRWAFIITGALGFFWVVAWWLIYKAPEKNPKVNAAELEYIRSKDESEEEEVPGGRTVTWGELFSHRQTYAILFSRFVTDWVWWFFLFWTPDFLNKTHGVDLKATVLPLIIIYTMSSIGGIYGGHVSSQFVRFGRSLDFARKTTILLFALLVLPLNAVPYIHNMWIVVLIIGLATSTHQAWASNIFTIVSDVYPKQVVGSMTGISSVGGAVGGALASSFVGLILEWTGSYATIFMIASTMYLLAWLTLKLFVPIKQIKFK